MGIRKHFEKKPTDEDLKLQDLSFEDDRKEKRPLFDPEEEISNEVRQSLFNELERERRFPSWTLVLRDAARLKIVFPERTEELKLDKTTLESIKSVLPNQTELFEKHFDGGSAKSYIEYMSDLRLCYPEEEYIADKDVKRRLVRAIRTFTYVPGILAQIGADLRIWTRKSAEELGMSDSKWNDLKEMLEKNRTESQWYDFLKLAANLKILHPERYDELKVDLEAWKNMKELLERFIKTKHWFVVLEIAFYLKVLAAEKINFTDQGMELVMEKSEDFKQTKKPRPERKNF